MIYFDYKEFANHVAFKDFVIDINKIFTEREIVEFLVLSAISMRALEDGVDNAYIKTKFDIILSMGFEWYDDENLAVVAIYDSPVIEEDITPEHLYAIDSTTIPIYALEEIDKKWETFVEKWEVKDTSKWKM